MSLPFTISARVAERGQVQVIATVDGRDVTVERYGPGDGDRRRKLAERWAKDTRLWNGTKPDVPALVGELERVELEALATVDALEQQCEVGNVVEGASYVEAGLAVELAWSRDDACADFIVCERGTGKVSRTATVDTAGGSGQRPIHN